jgi:hypothetical protein
MSLHLDKISNPYQSITCARKCLRKHDGTSSLLNFGDLMIRLPFNSRRVLMDDWLGPGI